MEQEQYKGKVIITSGRSIMALVAAHSLGKRGIEVVGADCVELTMLSFSKFVYKNELYENYLENEEQFLNDLENIVKKNKPEDDRYYVLMPIFRETTIITRNIHRFNEHITIATPDFETISKVHPKHNLAITAQKLGVNIPLTYTPQNIEELKNIKEKADFPFIIKPYNTSGGRGIKKVYNYEELKSAFEENQKIFNEPPLVQEIKDGEDYCLTALYQKGILKASMAYKNIKRFPSDSGSGVLRETIDDKPFTNIADQLLQPLGWNGIVQLDFLWSENSGEAPCLIEINPRFWAGLFQSVQSGIDYPWLNYLLFTTGELPEQQAPFIGEKTKIPVVWIFSAIEESLNFDKSFDEIKKAGKQAFNDIKNDNIKLAFEHLRDGVNRGLSHAGGLRKLKASIKEAQEAENEIFRKDDPQAAIGILYGFAYLIKYGKLPPEMGI